MPGPFFDMNSILNSLSTGFNNLLKNPQQAVGVATGINSLVTGTPAPASMTAANNTASASGLFSASGSSALIWIGAAVVGVIVLIFALKK